MRRKRLQHAADTLCQMFCGWRLVNSYRDLERLGTGHLTIDALSARCLFDGKPIEDLSIAHELCEWLREDLSAHSIPASEVLRAELHAELVLSRINSPQRSTVEQHIDRRGKPIRTGQFHRLRIECNSEVATNQVTYTGSRSDVAEWPIGWPAA
jgi:hypothetical protein